MREIIKNKFNGLCAYTGKPLGEDWQIDHIKPKVRGGTNEIDNLLPAIKIVNHYKRVFNLEEFREYMMSFHIRLKRVAKNPKSEKGIKRKEYMNKIAELFNIEVDKPFDGVFYFEKNKENENDKI